MLPFGVPVPLFTPLCPSKFALPVLPTEYSERPESILEILGVEDPEDFTGPTMRRPNLSNLGASGRLDACDLRRMYDWERVWFAERRALAAAGSYVSVSGVMIYLGNCREWYEEVSGKQLDIRYKVKEHTVF